MYAKIFSQIYDGTLCTNGPWEALVTFQQLLILADQDGNVDMTIPAISRRTTIPREIIERGIEALLLPDIESRTPTEGGRRIIPLSDGRAWGWKIVNYQTYRQIKREQDRRDYHREYYHKRKSEASTSTQRDSTSQPIAEAEAEAEAKTEAKKERVPRKRSTAPSAPDGVSQEVWADWLEVRKVKKAAVTGTSIEGIRAEAIKAGLTLQQALETCCRQGWAGFKAAWVTEASGARQPARQSAAPAQTDAQRTAEVRRLLGFDAIDGDVIEGGGHAR